MKFTLFDIKHTLWTASGNHPPVLYVVLEESVILKSSGNIWFKFNDLDVYWTTKPPVVPGAEKMGIGAHFEGSKGTLTC